MAARRVVWREAAVAAGSVVFAEAGYQAASMRTVAKEAGLSMRALYEAYAGKDELFLAVLDRAFANLAPGFEPDEPTSPGEAVLSAIDAMLASIDANRVAFVLSTGPAVRLKDGRDPFTAYRAVALEKLTGLVARALPQEPPRPEAVAGAIIAAVVAAAGATIADDAAAPVTRVGADLRAIFGPLLSGGEATS